ncbi:MAG TPA: TlyA family RNA methyltransferase [Thermoanaerobaculia bacterium]|nr:TlyA family RNA methyltransferase [Thermoanaerobaculia bacterium]
MRVRKLRLDLALVERGLVDSRSKAQSLIMARRITVNGVIAAKAGQTLAEDDELAVTELEHPWVGRGGMKLSGAVKHFGLSLQGLTCADIGASTGGFTDVMLENGAAKVYAIDVGYGQLDQSLRNDPRVTNREKVNARYLQPADFDEPIDFVSIDVSFISLRYIIPVLPPLLRCGGEVVALIKPQFEVGREEVGKGGIVRDEAQRRQVVDGIVAFAGEQGFEVIGTMASPIKGAEGNVEFLMYARLGK